MAWYDGLLNGAEDPRMAGLLGGLSGLGQGLIAAGAPRPVGQPGPGLGDAFGMFGQARRQAQMNAYQTAEMERKAQRQAMLQNARSDKPDEALSARERAMRAALASMPGGITALADDEQLPGLAIQRETAQMSPMSAAEVAGLGLPDGTVVYKNNFTGAPTVLHQSKLMSPAEYAQAIGIQRAGLQPQVQWTLVTDAQGNPIAKRGSNGDYVPLRQPSEGFTLGPGQQRFGPDGRVIAEGGPERPSLPAGMRMNPATGQAENIPGVAEAQAAAAAGDPTKQAGAAKELRSEYTKLTEDFRTVQDAFNKIEMAGKTGQGDMALLYGYMKILDPTSVVRESEFAMAAKSGSFGEQMQGLVTRVLNGERLPDSVRDGFKAEARNVYKAQSESYKNTQKIFRDLATRRGVKVEDVVLPYQFTDPAAPSRGRGGEVADPLGIMRR